MRWETARKKEGKFGDLSGHNCPCGNDNRDTEICKVDWKSQPELTSTDRDKIVPNKLPANDDRNCRIGTVSVADTDSGKCKMAMGTESGKTKISEDADSDMNKTSDVTENKENEANVTIASKGRANGVIVTQREKDCSKKQEKQREMSDDSSNEDSKNECTENTEEVTRKSVLNINIPSDSVSDVENQLKNLAITESGDGKGDLCERSPMGSERHRVRSDLPYPELAEPNNNVLPHSEPEFPFGEESSSPEQNNNILLPSSQGSLYGEESCPLPEVEQKDLDAWLNGSGSNVDKGSAENMNDSQLGYVEARDDRTYFNSSNIHPKQNEPCTDAVWPIPLFNSVLYRPTESITSLSSPSSGSLYSSECSPSSSPVPSLADSVTGKSDSDTENEFWKIESNLPIGYVSLSDVPSCSAQCVNDRSLNKLVTSNVISSRQCFPLASDPSICFPPSHSAIRLQSRQVQPVQSLITVQSVQPAQPANSLQPVQLADCWQPPQSVRGTQQTQLAVGVRQTQPAPPTNTQAVIIQSNVQPFPYIQQGPVIPETIAVSARERIATKVDKEVKDLVVMTLAKLTDDQLSRGDQHGDTQLMILIANKHSHKLEQIYVMVSRLKNISGALVARNAQNQSALSLACLFLHHMPFVARFIAEVMLDKGLPVNEVYDEGNTLLHMLCMQGDSHVYVLAELLSMKHSNSAPCFDVNQHNHREGTPLHVAVKKHSKKVNCSQTVAFLLSQGADVLAQERTGGLTALHMAVKESCDPLLVQLLLQAAERKNINLVSKEDYPGDTALHYVALRNDIALHQQARVVQLLVWYGAVSNRCGSQGRTPLALVSPERKHEIQKIIHRR